MLQPQAGAPKSRIAQGIRPGGLPGQSGACANFRGLSPGEINQVFEWVRWKYEVVALRPSGIDLMRAQGSRDFTGVYDGLEQPVWRQLETVFAVRERAGLRSAHADADPRTERQTSSIDGAFL